MTRKKIKAIILLSGGLDSTLAAKMMKDQGIDVVALNFISPFCRCTKKGCPHQATQMASQLDIPIKVIVKGEDYIKILKNPKFGYGKGANPCIDCRIFSFKKAKEYMKDMRASFIITGEVLGQRPFSQHKSALDLIEKESDLQGLVLKPLSAKLLSETIPEQKGWVDREKLLDISGRSRKKQLDLAEELKIRGYLCGTGGCLLVDPEFSKRIKDLFKKWPNCDLSDIKLLKIGRHFWETLNDTKNNTKNHEKWVKIVVGRNEEENQRIEIMACDTDILMEPKDHPGPTVLIRDTGQVTCDKKILQKAAKLILKYSHLESGKVVYGNKGKLDKIIEI